MESQKSFVNSKTACFPASVNLMCHRTLRVDVEIFHWGEATATQEVAQQPFLQGQAPDHSMPCFLPGFPTVSP